MFVEDTFSTYGQANRMSVFDEISLIPEDFSGRVRLFPMPNLVMFPNVVQALHVFEPRYCEMVEEALDDDQLIAMSLLNPGWEMDYEGSPSIAPVTCLGQIISHSRDEQGHYNILLLGVSRAEIIRELASPQAFRQADVELWHDVYTPAGKSHRGALQQGLLTAFHEMIPDVPQAQKEFDYFLGQPIPLGMLTDIAAFSLDFELAAKQRLLSECDVDIRAEALLAGLVEALGEAGCDEEAGQAFPPEFSLN